ncbi:MAG: hypothetical protein COC01_04390 [Bacteroidetes bacterium]|nr:MAG: hypothetical protein COC01_04390 [Bacteroidota bacterium]
MKFRFTVSRKISIGFAIVILLTIVSSSVILNTSTSLVTKFAKDISPSLSVVEDFNILVIESKMYITNWVYLPSSLEDKEALKKLQTNRYRILKIKILKLFDDWDKADKEKMDTVFMQYKELTSIQEDIMTELVTFDDYEDPMKKLFSENRIESEVLPLAADIAKKLTLISKHLNKNANDIRMGMFESFENLQWLIIGIAIFIICLGVFVTIMTVKTIVGPIKTVRQILLRMGLGELPENVSVKSNDEIGDMTTALNQLIDSGNKSASFASNIGTGDFSVQFEKLSDKDILGAALINMREDLKAAARKKELEKWAADGQVKFADIFNKHEELDELGDEVICSLVDYLDSNQARLYVANDAEEIKLEMLASTIKNEAKPLHRNLGLGDGIIGEVARDRQIIVLDTIPEGHFANNGDKGNGKLNKLVVSPLIMDNKLFGVIEIATNDEFKDHHISFVEQLGEKIAIKVNSTIINQRTRELLQKVHDSITYAERIQKSMLPTQETIQEHFQDSFMFYRPKDVISGDFPWFADMGDEKLIAACDCTGHGVPGAMMAIIGNFLLNQIVIVQKIMDPGKILGRLHDGVNDTLKQLDNPELSDGMDVALLNINTKTNQIQYAGAHRPLYQTRNGEIAVHKASRFPIGGTQYARLGRTVEYKNNVIDYEPGDVLHFFSDGLPDQTGGPGPEEEKLMNKRIKEVIIEHGSIPMIDQKLKFEATFDAWMGDYPQLDDVLLFGIRL